jgi:tRNA C32,U32 (ribose-2'-O)-methylase TrmJ
MTDTRFDAERRTDMTSKDLETVVNALQEAISVIDDHDPDRNPARCMRQLRRLFDNISLRAAIRRLAAELPLPPDSRRR